MLNFKKGSIFSRSAGNEDAYEEYEQEDQGGVLAVWGSPGSGKTTVAARIAKHLAGKRKNTILLLCDMSAPMLPCICPPRDLENKGSLGSVLAAAHVSDSLIKNNLTTHKRLDYLSILGLVKGESEYTYPPYESRELSKDKTKEYHNAVFVGIDEHGVARHAHKRGIYTQGKSYRGNVEGCDPRHSFHWTGTSDRLYVFEAPIDLLAFLTLYPEDWQQHSYVALCGTAEHAMLWMLEQNPKLQKIILCLDHDAAGIEAAGRLTDILCKHGYTQSAPLRSTNKDWDEDLKEQHGLEPQPPEEHPQLIVAGTICERIGAKCKAVRPEQASYQIPRLLQQYQNDLHWGRFEQAMDHMETMSALALSVVLRECRQMGTVLTEEQGARFLQSHIHPHQNRGSLKTRTTEIGMEFQSVLAKDAVEGIRTEVEKKATASAWLELAISCAKVPIKYCADELRRQQKEEKALLEAAQAMASY